jgi:hypothetical protein
MKSLPSGPEGLKPLDAHPLVLHSWQTYTWLHIQMPTGLASNGKTPQNDFEDLKFKLPHAFSPIT